MYENIITENLYVYSPNILDGLAIGDIWANGESVWVFQKHAVMTDTGDLLALRGSVVLITEYSDFHRYVPTQYRIFGGANKNTFYYQNSVSYDQIFRSIPNLIPTIHFYSNLPVV